MCNEPYRQCFGCAEADECEDLSDWLEFQATLEGVENGQEVSEDFWLKYKDCPFDKRCAECPVALHCPLIFFFREMLAGRLAIPNEDAPPVYEMISGRDAAPVYEMLLARVPSLFERLLYFILDVLARRR